MKQRANLSFNGKTFHHQTITTKANPICLLSFLKKQSVFPQFYLKEKNGSKERVALGSLIQVNHPIVFESRNTSSARFYGGCFFDDLHGKDSLWQPFPEALFFLPRWELIQDENELLIIEHLIEADAAHLSLDLEPSSLSLESFDVLSREDIPSLDAWNQLIIDTTKQLEKGPLKKVILARKTTLSCQNLCPFQLLSLIRDKNSSHTTSFAFIFNEEAAFIGATPERLYQRHENVVHCDAIAGTEENKDLLSHQKYSEEFDFVPKSIQDAITPFSHRVAMGDRQVLSLRNMCHYYQKIEAHLKEGIADLDLIQALHPTAAIGGFPKPLALSFIREHEPFDRGYYSGPIGWISQERASIHVAIRSALWQKNQLHLFAGAGIIAASNPIKEWDELERKISPIMECAYA